MRELRPEQVPASSWHTPAHVGMGRRSGDARSRGAWVSEDGALPGKGLLEISAVWGHLTLVFPPSAPLLPGSPPEKTPALWGVCKGHLELLDQERAPHSDHKLRIIRYTGRMSQHVRPPDTPPDPRRGLGTEQSPGWRPGAKEDQF